MVIYSSNAGFVADQSICEMNNQQQNNYYGYCYSHTYVQQKLSLICSKSTKRSPLVGIRVALLVAQLNPPSESQDRGRDGCRVDSASISEDDLLRHWTAVQYLGYCMLYIRTKYVLVCIPNIVLIIEYYLY